MSTIDKAEWHYGGEGYPHSDPLPAHLHTGIFLGWALSQGMVADDLLEDELAEGRDWVALQRVDPLSGLELYVERDGTLLEEDLNEAGQRFAAKHYNTFMGIYDHKVSARHGGPYRAPVSAETYHESAEWLDHLLHG